MEPAGANQEHDVFSGGSMSNAVIKALGTVLAVVALLLDGEAMRRRGGPGVFRRLASIAAAFFAFVVGLMVGRRAVPDRNAICVAGSQLRRHLCRPPQAWAAP